MTHASGKTFQAIRTQPGKWENVPTIGTRPRQVGKRPRKLELDPSKWKMPWVIRTQTTQVEKCPIYWNLAQESGKCLRQVKFDSEMRIQSGGVRKFAQQP
jgi:hypothetical protein